MSSFSGQFVGVYTVRPSNNGLPEATVQALIALAASHMGPDEPKKVRIFLGNMTQRMWFFAGKKQVGYKEKCGNFLVFTNIHSCLLLFGIPATIQCLLSTRRIPCQTS